MAVSLLTVWVNFNYSRLTVFEKTFLEKQIESAFDCYSILKYNIKKKKH